MLVVFIHNNFTEESVAKTFAETGRVIVFNQSAFGAGLQALISQGIATCAVPLFFLFAAFLQAKKADPYHTLLKKKAKSLALPYALWMAIYFLYSNVLKLLVVKIAPHLLGKPDVIPMLERSPAVWIQQLLGYTLEKGAGTPGIAGQFWFVRDLIIYTALSPAIAALLKRAPAATFGLVAGLYLLDLPVYFVATEGLFFYIAGLLWAMGDTPLLEAIDRVKWGEAVFLFAATFCFRHVFHIGGASRSLMVIAACVSMLKASKPIAESEKAFALASCLSRYSFFLFAIHMLLLNVLKRLWIIPFPMKNAFFCLFEYFAVTCIAIALALALGAALRKLCPPLFRLLNGGR